MKMFDPSLLIKALAKQAELDGMKVANAIAKARGKEWPYNENHFFDGARDLLALVQRADMGRAGKNENNHCPFCGAKVDPEEAITKHETRMIFWVRCPECGAAGPTSKDIERAIYLWGRPLEGK